MPGKSRYELFTVETSGAPDPNTDGRTTIIYGHVICRSCRTTEATITARTSDGLLGHSERVRSEAELIASQRETCSGCGAKNLSVVNVANEADLAVAS